jgi:hypothetical protein
MQIVSELIYLYTVNIVMQRRILHIVLSLLIVVSTSGVTVNMHYCHNRLISVGVLFNAKPCCNSKSCCHNEAKFSKVDDKATIANSLILDLTKIIKHFNLFAVDAYADYLSLSRTFYNVDKITHSPPGSSTRLSVLCCFLL